MNNEIPQPVPEMTGDQAIEALENILRNTKGIRSVTIDICHSPGKKKFVIGTITREGDGQNMPGQEIRGAIKPQYSIKQALANVTIPTEKK